MLHRFADSRFPCFREEGVCKYLILDRLTIAPQFHRQKLRKKRGRERSICGHSAHSAEVAADLRLSLVVRRGGLWEGCAWVLLRGQRSVRPRSADYFYCGPTGGNSMQKGEAEWDFFFAGRTGVRGFTCPKIRIPFDVLKAGSGAPRLWGSGLGCPPAHYRAAMNEAQLSMAHGDSSWRMNGPPAAYGCVTRPLVTNESLRHNGENSPSRFGLSSSALEIPSPVPKSEGPVAPSLWLEAGATGQG
jgi:hypothetical protein